MDNEDTISQEALLAGHQFDIFEASIDEGQTGRYEYADDLQSSVIIDRGRKSNYKVQALLKTCIHGVMDSTSNVPASLIIVEFSLTPIAEQGRYSSATMTFDFSPHMVDASGCTVQQVNVLDTPNVIAYAPFRDAGRWGSTTAQEDTSHKAELELGAEGIIGGKMRYAYEAASSHEQRYFTQGLAGWHFMRDHDIADHVWWNLQHNFSQRSGVPPHFRTAILVTRRAEAAQAEFEGKLNLAVRGGIGMKMSELKDRFLRRNAPEKPVLFNPSLTFMGQKLEGLEPNANGVYELGHLAKGQGLTKLSYVWGLEPLQAP